MKPLRVLYVSPVAERGGAERALHMLIKYHAPASVSPAVVFLEEAGVFLDDIRTLGIPVWTFRSPRVRNMIGLLRQVLRLAQLIRRQKTDMVASNTPKGHVFGGLASQLARRPSVWFAHGVGDGGPVERLSSLIPAARIFTGCQEVSTSLYRTVPRLKKRGTAFFPYAVDLEYLDPDTPGDALRQEWGVPRENVLVGMVARFEPWKGHREFLRAAALVRNASPSTRFVLVGDVGFGQAPEYRTQLEELASQLDLSHCLVFAGFRTDLPQCLAAIDVLVHGPVSDQPGGLISLDAMAMQRPVVATDTSRVDKLGWLLPHETGIVVPARDETQMADAILTLVASEKLRHEMGTRGRVYVEQQFSPEHLARHVEAEYLAIAGASGF